MSAAHPLAPIASAVGPSSGDAGLQARLLRNLAAWLDQHNDKPLPIELEEAIVEVFEDRLDGEAADKALAEEGSVSLDELKAKYGL